MIKKVGLASLMIVLVLALTACGASEEETNYNGNVNEIESGEIDWSRYPIIVNGVGITDSFQTVGEDEIFPTHVPLVAVAEAFDVEVEWDEDTDEVMLEGLNGEITFTVGSAVFEVDGRRVTLGQPSVEIDDTIYVPTLFFRDVFGAGSAYFSRRTYYD